MSFPNEDDSGPKTSGSIGWHERRIVKLEDAFLDISNKLLPSIARLEEKVNGMHESLSQLKLDMSGCKDELAVVKDEMHEEVTGNVMRDAALGCIQKTVETRKEQRAKLYWAIGKAAATVVVSVATAVVLVHFKLK